MKKRKIIDNDDEAKAAKFSKFSKKEQNENDITEFPNFENLTKSILKNHLIADLISIILGLAGKYTSKEYIFTKKMCHQFFPEMKDVSDLTCEQITKMVLQSEFQSNLNWGDVINIGNAQYRNDGRYFWIDNCVIPFGDQYDDYGSVYSWMTCNKVGSTHYWEDTASGHGDYTYFDHTGYKIIKIEKVQQPDYYCGGEHTSYMGTIINELGEKWFIQSHRDEATIKDIFNKISDNENKNKNQSEQEEDDIEENENESGQDADSQNELDPANIVNIADKDTESFKIMSKYENLDNPNSNIYGFANTPKFYDLYPHFPKDRTLICI